MSWKQKSKNDWGRLDLTSDYKTTSLGAVVDFIAKGIPPKYTDEKNENSVVVLNQKTNRNFQIDYSVARLNDLTKKKVAAEKLLKDNDILINSTGVGTAGRIAQLFSVPEPTTVDGHMIILRADSREIDPIYLGYALKSQQPKIESLQEGSTGQTELNRQRLLDEIQISFPKDRGKQEEIGSIFLSIDNRIEQNKEINHHLAEIAKSIFDSYFIDLSPYNGVMPDDWQLSNLTGIANYLNGLAMQKHRPQSNEQGLPVLKIKELRQGFTDSTSDLCSSNIRRDYIIHDGDVIFSWSGSLLVDFWTGGDCGLNQHLFKVSSETYDKWFYYAWTKHHLDRFVKMAADRATTMGHIKRDALEKAEVLIPNNKDYQEIGNKLKPIYDQIINNRVESRKLVALRDTLLPKLMSGKISVTD